MTLAPSLRELPPEKGSILELHSINEEFNGMLVEYDGIDSATGKFNVVSYDQRKQRMKVKTKVCRRPDLLPLNEREALVDMVPTMDGPRVRDSETRCQFERVANEMLRKDPCCAPAHFILGGCDVSQSTDNEAMKKSATKHYQRGFANLYAYEDLLDEEFMRIHQTNYSLLLSFDGHRHTLSRFQERTLTSQGRVPEDHEIEMAKLISARSLVEKAQEHYHTQERYDDEIKAYMEASEKICSFLRFVATSDRFERNQQNKDTRKGLAAIAQEDVTEILRGLLKQRTLIIEKHRATGDGRVKATPEMWSVCRKTLHVATETLEACTSRNGQILLLENDFKQFLCDVKRDFEGLMIDLQTLSMTA